MALDDIPRRVLLLGGSGLLGGALRRTFEAGGASVAAPASASCDVRDLAQVRRFIADASADLVVNSAAQSSVDQAEQRPEDTYAVNTGGAHNAALAAAEAGVPLMHISSDYVFDGNQREPYQEFCPTGVPPNHYGRSKLHAELLVRECCPRHFIVRVAALFGEGRRCFVTWVLDGAGPGRPLTIVNDRYASPTWTDDLARQLLVLARTPCYGTYHAAGRGFTSWYGLARAALELAGRDPRGVVEVPDAQLPSPARRAAFTALDNHLLRLRGLETMLPWRQALAAFIAGLRAGGET